MIPPVPTGFGTRIARASGLMLLFKLITRSIGLVSTLILARLLTPADFGLVAMAMSVVALTELIGAFGFDVALIQRQDPSHAHYNAAWTLNVVSGVVMAVLMLAATLPAAAFYNEPRLTLIVPALAVGAIITGFENIGVVEFRITLDFESEVKFLLTKQITAFIVTVPLALVYRSYWALIAGTVAARFFSLVASYHLHAYRPRFSLAARKDLLHFSKWLLVSNLVAFLQNRSADFILGRTVGPIGLGLYKVAFDIAAMPSTELIAPVNRAVFPAYSRLTHDPGQLRRQFLEVFGLIALFAFPVSVGLACVAGPMVLAVLGDQWIDSIPILRLFTVAGLASALQGNLYLMLMALGKPKVGTLVGMGTLALSLPVFVAASLKYGALGAAWTYMMFSVVGLVIINIVFLRTTRVRVLSYLSTLARPVMSALTMSVVLFLIEPLIANAADNNLVTLLLMIVVGASIYIASELLLWWLSGRPPGAERTSLEFVSRQVKALRSRKDRLPHDFR